MSVNALLKSVTPNYYLVQYTTLCMLSKCIRDTDVLQFDQVANKFIIFSKFLLQRDAV